MSRRLFWAVWGLSAALCVPAQAQQGGVADKPGSQAKPPASQKKTAKANQTRSNPPKVLPGGSGESPEQRAARLKRECKGLPNAGACTGYTQ